MRRVLIVGPAGAGKSTLARALGARLGLPVVHMDPLFWRPGWTEPKDRAEFRERVAAAISGDAWITDGNFVTDTFPLRLPRADTLVILDPPVWLCLLRVLWRAVFHRTRVDLPEGCPEQLDGDLLAFVMNFRRKSLPAIESAIAAHGGPLEVVRLRNDREFRRFVAAAT